MDRIYDWLLAAGYPRAGVDWLRQRRLAVIIVLAILSWVVFLVLGWGAFQFISGLVAGQG